MECHMGMEMYHLAIMALEVQIHALAKARLAQNSLVHTNDFSSLLVF